MQPPPPPSRGNLPPGHSCRTDDLQYESVGAWYEDHRGRVPIQAAQGLDRYVRSHGCSFAEAFQALRAPSGPMILLDDASPPGRPDLTSTDATAPE
jgi:hypothetical protein